MGPTSTQPANRTLVAYYGPKKPPALATLLLEMQQLTRRHFGDSFEPYELDQMHATLIGLESIAVKRVSASGDVEELVVSQHALDQSDSEATHGVASTMAAQGAALPYYVVLGRLRSRPERQVVEALEDAGRGLLADTAVLVDLSVSSTRLVEYVERTLPMDSTRVLFGHQS